MESNLHNTPMQTVELHGVCQECRQRIPKVNILYPSDRTPQPLGAYHMKVLEWGPVPGQRLCGPMLVEVAGA